VTLWGRTPVYLWILFLAACAVIVSQARFTTDLSAFLPRSPTPSQRILVDQLHEGVVSADLDRRGRCTASWHRSAMRLPSSWHAIRTSPMSATVRRSAGSGRRVPLRNRYLLSPGYAGALYGAGLRAALQDDLDRWRHR
jgi:predicted exporter